jgi:hypothetical protein
MKSPGSPFGFWTTIVGAGFAVSTLAWGWDEQAHSDELPAAMSSIRKFCMGSYRSVRLRGPRFEMDARVHRHPPAVDKDVTQERAVQDVGVRGANARIAATNRKHYRFGTYMKISIE